MSHHRLTTAKVFRPLEGPARYKGAYGGRGSGKSHFFAESMVMAHSEDRTPGNRSVCVREVQRTLAESSKKLIEDKIVALGLGHRFTILKDRILCRGGGSILFIGMQDYTAERIKSLENVRRAWIEEAQTLSERSLALLRPTIRAEGSEIWASWNPRRKSDAIDRFLRQNPPDNAAVVRANWSDNPWFPDVLKQERLHDLAAYPDRYDHIWEGGYARALDGAYYARPLAEAAAQGRIAVLTPDPLLPVRAYWDLGGAGARADAMAIWIAQFVRDEIRVLDYIEGQGQVLGFYADELRARGWSRAQCVLPHDGLVTSSITGKRIEDHLREAGFYVRTIANQGGGAARQRIEAARRLFPRIRFDGARTEPGREALGWYHERRDEARELGLGPSHDWSSHAADAFGLMCLDYEEPRRKFPAPVNDISWIV
jgi:phage terminase large subunit